MSPKWFVKERVTLIFFNMANIYRYFTRPAKETGNLLIEFPDLPHDKDFIKQLIRVFSPITMSVENYEDLWMHDEIVINATSDIGKFTIYRDAEDFYYLTANDNPDAIPLLAALLFKSPLFKKAE